MYRVVLKTEKESMEVLRLQEGRFHVYKHGIDGLLLARADYILARSPLVDFLKTRCYNEGDFIRVEVIQKVTQEKWEGYSEIAPRHEITVESMSHTKSSGFHIWHYNRGTLFISEDLMNEMKKEQWSSSLIFYEGFSMIA